MNTIGSFNTIEYIFILKYKGVIFMNRVQILSTSLMITECCTLKCKLCLAYVPYYDKPRMLSFKEAQSVLESYFQIIDTVDKFSITGGEPLINPYINDIIQLIVNYEDQIKKEIILITNGTIEVSESLLETLSQSKKIKVIVNNYGNLSKHAKSNYMKLKEHNINAILYTEENRVEWIDCRDHNLKHTTKIECEKQASSCAFFTGKKYIINRGQLHTCTRSFYRIYKELIPFTDKDYIDLLDEGTSIEQKRKHLSNLLACRSTISCAYCDGRTEQARLYPAAEQIK